MRRLLALSLCILLGSAQPDAPESAEAQVEFMRGFFCVMATQRFLMQKSSDMPPIANNRDLPDSWRRLMAISFGMCLDDLHDQQLMMSLAAARTQEDIERITFPFTFKMDVPKYVAEGDFTITPEEQAWLVRSKETADKIAKMQQEQRKAQAEQGHDPHEHEHEHAQTQHTPTNDKVDWIDWAMNSQFRNVFIFSAIALVVIVVSSVGSLFKSAPQPQTTEKEVQARNKKDADAPKKSAEPSEGATVQDKKVRKRD